jgi:exopolyphosphatase
MIFSLEPGAVLFATSRQRRQRRSVFSDSVVSSLCLAFFSDANEDPGAAVPVVNCTRADFPLRGDALAALAAAGINSELLLFIDDTVNLTEAVSYVTLVDHNQPAAHQRDLSRKVSAIIDHHDDAGAYPDVHPRVVAPTGSCSTLVFELCNGICEGKHANLALAALMTCTILIDTVNLDASIARFSARDVNALGILSTILDLNNDDLKALYLAVNAKKQEQGHLSTYDLLRRDYKQFENGYVSVGIASVGISFSEWSTRSMGSSHALTVDALQHFAVLRKVHVIIVMTSFGSGEGFTRQLLVLPATCTHADLAQ